MAGAASVAFRDLAGSVVRLPLAFRLALEDINAKYRRTVLGPLWIVMAQAATVAGFVTVFTGFFGTNAGEYAMYVSAGLPIWALMASYFTDMPMAFITVKGYLESFEVPWLTHIWRRSFTYVLVFLHQLVTLIGVIAITQIDPNVPDVQPTIEMLYAVPALGIIMLGGTGLGMLLALLGARYRDLQPAMQMATSFLFLFTPVMWKAGDLNHNQWAVHYNPLYYAIELVRAPLLGRVPPPDLWIGVGGTAAGLFVLGFIAFFFSRRRLYHWL